LTNKVVYIKGKKGEGKGKEMKPREVNPEQKFWLRPCKDALTNRTVTLCLLLVFHIFFLLLLLLLSSIILTMTVMLMMLAVSMQFCLCN